MKSYSKSFVALAALSLGVAAMAQHHGSQPSGPQNPMSAPTPRLYTGPITSVEPISIQPVMKFGGKVIALGPAVKYHPSDRQARRIGPEIFDAFEGNSTNNGNPDVPTDGLYGENFLPATPGNRWYFGDTWVNTALIRHYERCFPGQAGKTATGLDFLVYNDGGTNVGNVTEVLFFTSSDPFDRNNPVPPTNFNTGVKLTYNPILPAHGVYSNVDLTASPLAMPTGTNGWFEMIIASGDDASGNPIEASAAQPLMWGTKALNPSVVGDLEYQDGTGTGTDRTGTPDQLFTWDFGKYSSMTPPTSSYQVTRGVETSTHNNANLSGTAGQNVVVSQRPQIGPAFNNAEVIAKVTLDPATPANTALLLLRAIVVAKANANQLSTSLMTVSWFNNSTNTFDTLYSGPAINAGTDGTVLSTLPALQGLNVPNLPGFASPAIANIPNYIATDGSGNRTVQIKIGVRQLQPLSPAWNLTINKIQVVAATIGPNPVSPGVAFSTTQ